MNSGSASTPPPHTQFYEGMRRKGGGIMRISQIIRAAIIAVIAALKIVLLFL